MGLDAIPETRLEKLERRARAQIDYAQELRALARSDAFAALAQQMSRAKEKVMSAHVRALMRGDTLDQRQMDYDRGYWDGVEAVLHQPDRIEQELEATLRQLQTEEARQSRT
jgi:hypothetical protein